MDAIIISAFKDSASILNGYRRKLLQDFLVKSRHLTVYEALGTDENGQVEPVVWVPFFDTSTMDCRVFYELAKLFEQEYFVRIHNDEAWKCYTASGMNEKMGIVWDMEQPGCPLEVKESCARTTVFRPGRRETTYGIQTIDMMKNPKPFPTKSSRLEADACKARQYPY